MFVYCCAHNTIHDTVVARSVTQEQIAPKDVLYINLPNALQYSKGTFYGFRDVTNAFISLLERSENPHTVFWVDHPSIYEVAPVIQAETKPLWLQVVHDINVYNYIRGSETDAADYLRHFPCDFSAD